MNLGVHATYFLGLVIAVAVQQPADQESVSSLAPPAHETTAKFVGSDACVQCHKNGHDFADYAVAGKEYSIWVNRDPHSCAYSNLFNEKSKSIARKLKLDTPPHNSDLCLNCHATNVSKQRLALNTEHTLTDGVGCESCHGPAEKWLVPHKLSDWKYWSPSQKSSIGFVDTDNIATRARTCVQCHVGSAGRDVNHDLIAAGHPRLYFEMSAYQSKMPRHWSRAKDLMQNSAMTESRLWLVGQYVSAAASLELQRQRANNAKSPWPEFAEYNCSSCHHDLAEVRWKKGGFFANAAGNPTWGTWHFSMLEQLSKNPNSFSHGDFNFDVEKLRDEMQNPTPERDAIGPLAITVRKYCDEMADCLSQAPLTEQDAEEFSSHLIASEFEGVTMNWDVLTQRYLAAVAFRQSLMDSRSLDGRFSAPHFEHSKLSLLKIRDTLKFIENYDGPRELDANQRKRIDQGFGEILHLFKN